MLIATDMAPQVIINMYMILIHGWVFVCDRKCFNEMMDIAKMMIKHIMDEVDVMTMIGRDQQEAAMYMRTEYLENYYILNLRLTLFF